MPLTVSTRREATVYHHHHHIPLLLLLHRNHHHHHHRNHHHAKSTIHGQRSAIRAKSAMGAVSGIIFGRTVPTKQQRHMQLGMALRTLHSRGHCWRSSQQMQGALKAAAANLVGIGCLPAPQMHRISNPSIDALLGLRRTKPPQLTRLQLFLARTCSSSPGTQVDHQQLAVAPSSGAKPQQ